MGGFKLKSMTSGLEMHGGINVESNTHINAMIKTIVDILIVVNL